MKLIRKTSNFKINIYPDGSYNKFPYNEEHYDDLIDHSTEIGIDPDAMQDMVNDSGLMPDELGGQVLDKFIDESGVRITIFEGSRDNIAIHAKDLATLSKHSKTLKQIVNQYLPSDENWNITVEFGGGNSVAFYGVNESFNRFTSPPDPDKFMQMLLKPKVSRDPFLDEVWRRKESSKKLSRKPQLEIGTWVDIVNNPLFDGFWGKIVDYDGHYYYVSEGAFRSGEDKVFIREELKEKKSFPPGFTSSKKLSRQAYKSPERFKIVRKNFAVTSLINANKEHNVQGTLIGSLSKGINGSDIDILVPEISLPFNDTLDFGRDYANSIQRNYKELTGNDVKVDVFIPYKSQWEASFKKMFPEFKTYEEIEEEEREFQDMLARGEDPDRNDEHDDIDYGGYSPPQIPPQDIDKVRYLIVSVGGGMAWSYGWWNEDVTKASKKLQRQSAAGNETYDYPSLLIGIPEELREQLKEVQKTLLPKYVNEKQDPKTFHITLLYGIKDKDIGRILSEELQNFKPFKIKVSGYGWFDEARSREDNSSVLFVKVTSPQLKKLHERLKKKFKNDHHPGDFKPHLTLAYMLPKNLLNRKKAYSGDDYMPTIDCPEFEWECDTITVSYEKPDQDLKVSLARKKLSVLVNSDILPGVLYHYTDYTGAAKILKTNKMRAGYFNENKWISLTSDRIPNDTTLPALAEVRITLNAHMLLENYQVTTGESKHEDNEYTVETSVIPNIKSYITFIETLRPANSADIQEYNFVQSWIKSRANSKLYRGNPRLSRKDTVTLYHYTKSDPVKIEEEGLIPSKDLGIGYQEAEVFFYTYPPNTYLPYFQLEIPKDDPKLNQQNDVLYTYYGKVPKEYIVKTFPKKTLQRTAHFYNAYQVYTTFGKIRYTEVFKNPTQNEMKAALDASEDPPDAIRGGFDQNLDMYVWRGDVLHIDFVTETGISLKYAFDYTPSDTSLHFSPQYPVPIGEIERPERLQALFDKITKVFPQIQYIESLSRIVPIKYKAVGSRLVRVSQVTTNTSKKLSRKSKSDETIAEGEYADFVRTDEGYEYLSGENPNGVAVLIYRTDSDKPFLGRFERIPAHEEDKPELHALTGTIDGDDSPKETAVREVEEESGYKITKDELIPLGEVNPAKNTDWHLYMFAVHVGPNHKQVEPVGDGTEVEKEAYNDWVDEQAILDSEDAVLQSLVLNWKNMQKVEGAVYPGNMGIEELYKFWQQASPEQEAKMLEAVEEEDLEKVEDLIEEVLHVRLYPLGDKMRLQNSIICRASTTIIEIPFSQPQDTFTIFYDIDGTIARYTGDYEKYEFGEPIYEVVDVLNHFKADGAQLIPYTSRKDDEKEALLRWLDENNIPYDDIIMNKPHFDVLIDDKVAQFTGDPVALEETIQKFREEKFPYWKCATMNLPQGENPLTPFQNYDEGFGRSEQKIDRKVRMKEKDIDAEEADSGPKTNHQYDSRNPNFHQWPLNLHRHSSLVAERLKKIL